MIFDIFSKRRKRELEGSEPDVWQYETIPAALRVQIAHVWKDAIDIGGNHYFDNNQNLKMYGTIFDVVCREWGRFQLLNRYLNGPAAKREQLIEYFVNQATTSEALDIIEVSTRVIDKLTRDWTYGRTDGDERVDKAIEEINGRFREHGVGYIYESGQVVRVDSQFIHKEAVKPALIALADGYETAESEFLAAHKAYKEGKFSLALIECAKSFESVLKVICQKRGWAFDQAKGPSHLVDVCLRNSLVESYWQNHFSGLRSVLESAVPTPRNKGAAHGAGSAPPHNPPRELTSFVMHNTAAALLYLIQAERKLR